jgi:flagellin-like protein
MGKMKANRKFIEADDRAVSAVIGVILMVAITVAIAATVYVYVSGMLGGGQTKTPDVAFTKSGNTMTVSRADNDADWFDFKVTYPATITMVKLNNTDIGGDKIIGPADNTYIKAGDTLTITGVGSFQIIHTPTNSLIGTWTFT